MNLLAGDHAPAPMQARTGELIRVAATCPDTVVQSYLGLGSKRAVQVHDVQGGLTQDINHHILN